MVRGKQSGSDGNQYSECECADEDEESHVSYPCGQCPPREVVVAISAMIELRRCGLMQHGEGEPDNRDYAHRIKCVPFATPLNIGGFAGWTVHDLD